MKFSARVISSACGIALAALASPSFAQGMSQTGSNSSTGASWIPYTSSGYVGLSVGRADYNTPCGVGLTCDNSNAAFKIYTGGSINEWLGVEFGYLNWGDADRNGGETSAHGLNLSLVGTVPLGERVHFFGKVGATYSRTETTAIGGSPVLAGKESGFGASAGLGVAYHFNQNWSGTVAYERHMLRYLNGRQGADLASVGVQYRF